MSKVTSQGIKINKNIEIEKEYETGRKILDKYEYVKFYSGTITHNNQIIDSSLDFSKIVKMEGINYTNNGYYYPLPWFDGASRFDISIMPNGLRILCSEDAIGRNFIVSIYYLK